MEPRDEELALLLLEGWRAGYLVVRRPPCECEEIGCVTAPPEQERPSQGERTGRP